MIDMMKTFSARLRSRRVALGLSQIDLGKSTGVHRTSIGAYEDGKRTPTAEVFMLMAQTLQVDPGWLMGLKNDMGDIAYVPVYRLPAPGEPLETTDNQTGTELVKTDDEITFCLIAKDSSMQGIRIYPGDLVCIKKEHPIVSGDVVVVNHPEQGVLIRRIIVHEKEKKVAIHGEYHEVKNQVFDSDQWDQKWVIGKVVYSKNREIW